MVSVTLGSILSEEKKFGQLKCTPLTSSIENLLYLMRQARFGAATVTGSPFRAAKAAKTFGMRSPRLTKIRLEGPLSQLLPRNWIYKQGRFMGETNCFIRAFTVAA